ncbi:MAG: glycosyltransferase family 4 protein [Muribaculum sp.]|nr:glycosyltransferase family 4 protein [Muribaculum sp.]
MKIALVITDISLGGGMERVTSLLANNLQKRGNEVEIISLTKENDTLIYQVIPDVNVNFLTRGGYGRYQSHKERYKKQIEMILKLKTGLRRYEDYIFIAQGFLPSLFLYVLGKGSKTIVCEHFKYEIYSNKLVRSLRNYIYKKLFKVVTLTEKDAEKFKSHGIGAITIPNMTTFDVSGDIGLGVISSKKILSVGRLEKQKGYDLLIETIRKIHDELNGWCIDVYGWGGEKYTLLNQLKESHCDDIITFKGFSKDINYDDYAFMVVPSRFEGFPMTILESLSKGLPVISFDCPEGPGVLLQDGVGELIPSEDIDKLALGILKIKNNKEKRITFAKKGLERVKEYTPENIMAQWDSLLHISK